MKRKCTLVAKSQNGKVSVFVDNINKDEIIGYANRDKRHVKKIWYIVGLILDNLATRDHYCLVRINDDCKDVREMRFFVDQENDRIYCKHIESEDGIKIIVASVLHEKKKNTKLKQVEKNIINEVGGFEYEI